MKLFLSYEENELVSALSSNKIRSVSKVSNYVGDLDSRRSIITGTVAMGKMTQMTDVTLPVAMDTDSEDEVEVIEKSGHEPTDNNIEGKRTSSQSEKKGMEGETESAHPLTDEEKVRERSRSRASIMSNPKSSSMSRPMSRPGFDTGRSGAIGGLGLSQQTPIYTSQSEHLPAGRYTVQSTHHEIVSVEVLLQDTPRDKPAANGKGEHPVLLERPKDALNKDDDGKVVEKAQEKNARHQTGAISAPPSMEPEDEQVSKKPDLETPREDDESEPVLPPSRQQSAAQSVRSLGQRKPDSTPKQAFRTPRVQSSSSESSLSDESFDLDQDEGFAKQLTPRQSDAFDNLKSLMEEEEFNGVRQKTIDSLRTALRTVSSEKPFRDLQLERTVTILSLASQIARESIELGISDGVFNGFGNTNSREMSVMSGKELSMKGSAFSKSIKGSAKPKESAKHLDDKGVKSVEPQKPSKPDQQSEINLQADKTKEKPQRYWSRSPSPRSPTPKLFEIKNEATQSKPSTRSSAFTELTMSGSMYNRYDSPRSDSFSESIPDTPTSSERRKMTHDDPNSPNAPKSAKKGIKVKNIEQKERSKIAPKQDDNVTMETVNIPEKRNAVKAPIDKSKAQPAISTAISPKKKTRPVTLDEMLYGTKVVKNMPITEVDVTHKVDPAGKTPDRNKVVIKMPKTEVDVTSMVDPTSPYVHDLEPMMVKGQIIPKKSAGRVGTAERNRLSRSSKPLSAKSKSTLKSPHTQKLSNEPSIASIGGNLNRQTSFVSSQTLLTAPTPGTNVSDFERPLSKGSFQSVDIISVSVNTAPSGGRGADTSDLIRPLSISSVKPVICSTPPPNLCKETQTDITPPEIDVEPVVGTNEEDIRLTSAKSRASLRNQFKSRLDETRNAVEERRIKSPIIPIPTQKSVDDELISDDDDDDDIDLPIPDDLKEEALQREDTLDAGTSPPPVPKHSKRSSLASRQSLSEHPLVQQYLRAYTGVHNFKEALSRIMVDKDQMSASQILTDLDMVPFDKDNKVVPQIETMTENIYYVLNELSQVINSVLQNDRGPVVSSLMMGMSRDTTQRNIREKSGFTSDLQPPTRSSERSASTKAESMISDSKYRELNDQYEKLQNQMAGDTKRYEDQQRHNMVVMMEMQDTINQLQRELSALGKQGRRPVSEGASTSVTQTQQQQDSAIMFTRLDSERNAKIMKKAVNEEKLEPYKYKEAVVQMDDYVNLPAQRLAHLVRKYVHHCRMKEIEDNVQHSKSLNENVFEILDKMENLQNQRAKRWADRMDEMGMERMRLANMLMETLDGIEQESGIFLIKPMFSYRGRESKDRFSAKTTRPLRPQRTLSPLRDSNSAYAPAPTPASNVRPYMRHSHSHSHGKGDTNMINIDLYIQSDLIQEYRTIVLVDSGQEHVLRDLFLLPRSILSALGQKRPTHRISDYSVGGFRPRTCVTRPVSSSSKYSLSSRPKTAYTQYSQSHDYNQPRREIKGPLEGDNTGLMGSSVNYVGIQPKATWSMNDSQPQGNLYSGTVSNTPRILELDINRMMIGQNTISAHIGNPIPSNDRLVNATSNNLRSYMTVNRPTGPGSASKSERPTSGSRGMDRSSTSPTTQSPSSKHVRLADIDVPTVIPNTQPLPPIGQTSITPDRPSSSDLHRRTPTRIPSGDDIPASPPGSSLRQSPPLEIEGELS